MTTESAANRRPSESPRKIGLPDLNRKKKQREPITMLTAYDYPTALAADRAGVDIILVGDSLGMVVLGYENTLAVTMQDMLHHCKAVRRGAAHAFLVGDMPFLSYQVSISEAVYHAGLFLQQAGMDAVKLEGGRERLETVRAIVAAGIPVMGHLGLTPQSLNLLGGYRMQGKTAAAARRILEDALLLQEVGCFSLVLESVPARLAAFITERLEIPTIGIGAGVKCDGQVLVAHDVLGMFDRFTPRFAKRYRNLFAEMEQAFSEYIQEVKTSRFPAEAHTADMPDEEWAAFLNGLES